MTEEVQSEVVVVEDRPRKQSIAAQLGFNPKGMHPGVIDKHRQHPKEDTSKPYKGGKGKLAQHSKRLGRRRTAHSDTIRGAKQPMAYKTPGSMKQHNGG